SARNDRHEVSSELFPSADRIMPPSTSSTTPFEYNHHVIGFLRTKGSPPTLPNGVGKPTLSSSVVFPEPDSPINTNQGTRYRKSRPGILSRSTLRASLKDCPSFPE